MLPGELDLLDDNIIDKMLHVRLFSIFANFEFINQILWQFTCNGNWNKASRYTYMTKNHEFQIFFF